MLAEPSPFSLPTVLFAAIGRLLDGQPGARAHLARHAGKRVALRLPILSLDFRIGENGGLLAEATSRAAPAVSPDCEITLDPALLLRLLAGDGQALRQAAVAGDAVLAADLATVLDRFDWALAFRPYLGDILAARAAQGISGFDRWRVEAQTSLGQAAAEYLSHESGLLADAPAVLGFVADVDELRDAAARLEARLTLLENRHA